MVDAPTPPTLGPDLVTKPDLDPRPKRRWLRRSLIAAQILLGLVLGLAAAEYAFTKRDDGAFPHVNFYVADPELGVRLEPAANMRFRLHDNPLSTITVNAQGYRGADWPAEPAQDEIVVLGDSQVFGLGVNDDETFSARLAELTGRPVRNAGVPTYGPLEYLAITQELLEQRRPKTVVYVLNFLNDPFELERPNLERHAVWDGWAVRSETAPASVRSFPGRRWLFSQSHMIYAARRWLHERDTANQPQDAELGLPSEGDWGDLVAKGQSSIEHDEQSKLAAAETLAQRRKRLQDIDKELDSSQVAIDDLILEEIENLDPLQAKIARARPGDIVDDDYSEASRSIVVTAAHIRRAARERQEFITQLREDPGQHGSRELSKLVTTSESLAKERQRLRLEIAAGKGGDPQAHYPSVFDDHLALLADLCANHGAELIVVALPVDVQVNDQEWLKYDVDPSEAPDMEPSLALLGDLLASAEALGARGLDATPALREAGPGAFLHGDIHMTATGHQALAEALATTLTTAPPPKRPRPGLPKGHSFAPTPKQWTPTTEVFVKGSTKAGCSTQALDGWLKVVCTKPSARAPAPTGVEVLVGETPETMTLVTADGVALVTPLSGKPFTARFNWANGARELRITWPPQQAKAEAQFHGEFVTVETDAPPAPISAEATQLCACQQELTQSPTCAEAWGEVSAACFATYAGEQRDCENLIACVQGDPLAAPTCAPGLVNATATNHCYRPCDDSNPCPTGTCTPYNGASLCFPA